MDQTPLPQRGAHGPLERADQPGRAVADHQQRAAQPAFAEPGEEPFPRVAGLTGRRVQPDEHRLADKSLIYPLPPRPPARESWRVLGAGSQPTFLCRVSVGLTLGPTSLNRRPLDPQ